MSRAEQRLSEVQQQVDKLRARRDAAQKLYEVEFGDVPPLQVAPAPARSTQTQSRRRRDLPRSGVDGGLSGLTWQDALRSVLAESEPLHVRDIWERLDAGGFSTDARDPLRSIVAVALRMPEIVRAGPNIYTLADERVGRQGGRGMT